MIIIIRGKISLGSKTKERERGSRMNFKVFAMKTERRTTFNVHRCGLKVPFILQIESRYLYLHYYELYYHHSLKTRQKGT